MRTRNPLGSMAATPAWVECLTTHSIRSATTRRIPGSRAIVLFFMAYMICQSVRARGLEPDSLGGLTLLSACGKRGFRSSPRAVSQSPHIGCSMTYETVLACTARESYLLDYIHPYAF